MQLYTQRSRETRGMILGVIAVIGFSATLPATRLAVAHLHPMLVGLGRALPAALVAAAILAATRQRRPNRTELKQLLFVAAGIVVGFPFFTAWAMVRAPAAHGGVVLGILPLATALAGAWLARERPTRGFWAAAIAGTATVSVFSWLRAGGAMPQADLLLLGAVACAAFGYARGTQLARTLGGWQVVCWALVVAAPFLLVPVAWLAAHYGVSAPPSAWAGFLYVALISQLFAFFPWYEGLALGGIARVSQTQLLQPFFTLIAAAAIGAETVDALTWMFAALVVAIVAVGKRMPATPPAV